MSVIPFITRNHQNADGKKPQQSQIKQAVTDAEIISLDSKLQDRGVLLAAPSKVEAQIKSDLMILKQEFFDILPKSKRNSCIRLSSAMTYTKDDEPVKPSAIQLEGDIILKQFYQSVFNDDDTYLEIFNWLKVNISLIAYAKEVTDYSIKHTLSPIEASRKYSHINSDNNGIDFWLEYRDDKLIACAQTPLQRYCKAS